MIKDAIVNFKKSKMAIAEKLSTSSIGYFDEVYFLDDGMIQNIITNLKKSYQLIVKKIDDTSKYSDSSKDTNNVTALMQQKEAIQQELAFFASNSIENIQSLQAIIDGDNNGSNSSMSICLRALISYQQGERIDACKAFEEYFQSQPDLPKHFLANQIYGELLMQDGKIEKALVHLRLAAEMKPENLHTHYLLESGYRMLCWGSAVEVERSIIDLLEKDGGYQND